MMKDELRNEGERVRLARSGWCPAKHIFAPFPSRKVTLCASTGQRQLLEDRAGVRRETPGTRTRSASALPRRDKTVTLPNHSDPRPGQIKSSRGSWLKCLTNEENPNQAPSQCVAVSRSDKIVKWAGRHTGTSSCPSWPWRRRMRFFSGQTLQDMAINQTKESNLIQANPTKSHHFETFFYAKIKPAQTNGSGLYR